MIGVKHRARADSERENFAATCGTATEFNNAAYRPRDRLEFNTNLKEISSVFGAKQGSLSSLAALPQEVNFRDNERAQKHSSHGGAA